MSLVTVVGAPDFVTIMSDGRAYDSGKSEIYKNDLCKVKKVSESIMIGCTGSYLQCKSILSGSDYWLRKSEGDIKKFAKNIQMASLRDVPKSKNPNITVHVAVCGVTKSNITAVFLFTNDEKYDMKVGKFDVPGSATLGHSQSSDYLDRKIKSVKDLTVEKALKFQTDTNDFISDLDPTSVNKTTFHEVVYVK